MSMKVEFERGFVCIAEGLGWLRDRGFAFADDESPTMAAVTSGPVAMRDNAGREAFLRWNGNDAARLTILAPPSEED